MDKNFLNDVIPPAEKKSIRDIPVPERRQSFRDRKDDQTGTDSVKIKKNINKPFSSKVNKKTNMKWTKIVVALLLIFILLINVSNYFAYATITVTAKTASSVIDGTFDISEIGSTSSKNSLEYKQVSFEETASILVQASGEAKVEEKATGKITIFNEYAKTPQRLIQNTRFESPEGLIFRVSNSVIIPGYTEKDGSKIPGQVDVVVTADQAGEKYNIEKTDFTIPGFKNSPQFKTIYAKSKSSMVGGFIGIRKSVSEKDRTDAETKIQGDLTTKLMNKAKESAGEDSYIIYSPDNFDFELLPQENAADQVKISMKGTLKSKVFAKYEISKQVAESVLGTLLPEEKILITNLQELTIKDESSTTLSIKGKTEFKWVIDSTVLKKAASGRPKTDLENISKNFPSIAKVSSKNIPFWKSNFPKNPEKIKVTITNLD